jgi:ribonuclease J
MLFNGLVVGSLAVDATGRIMGQARVTAPGLFEPDDPETDRISREFGTALADLPAPLRRDTSALEDAARATLRKIVGRKLGKKPIVDVHLLKV